MKVNFFLDNSCRYDSRVLREAGSLAANGHTLEILAFRDGGPDLTEERDGFKIIRLPGISQLRRFQWMQLFYSAFGIVRYYVQCWILLKDKCVDVCHCHDLWTLPIGYIVKRLRGCSLVYDSHELYLEQASLGFLRRLLGKIIERALIGHADNVITVNSFIAEELLKRYKIRLPLVIANYPLTTTEKSLLSYDNIRDTLSVPDIVPIILYIGGYVAGRGLENLILSAKFIRQGVIVFIGFGTAEGKLKELVKEHSLTDKVKFTGPVSPDSLIQYIESASLGVVLFTKVDLNNYYCSPNKLFEYINAGLPVVCSDFPFMKSVVENYEVGKTCNPDDPECIASAINWVLEDNERYRYLKRNVLSAAGIFNWGKESRKLIALYEELGKKMMQSRGEGARCAA